MQTKKNPDGSYGQKLVALFAKLLFTGERYSLSQLANMLQCSKQTVLRLIDDITLSYDVVIRDEIVGNRKYVWLERTHEIEPTALLSASELRTLQMCQAFTQHLLGKRSYQEAARAVEKSCHHLPPREEPGESIFGMVHGGTIDYSGYEEILNTLLEGMESRRVCAVGYRRLNGDEVKHFHLKPLKIFAHHATVYVHGRLAKSPGKPYKTPQYDPFLALQRFESVELTDTPFRRPANYDFDKAVNSGFGIWANKRFRVVMDLTGWAAALARERIWSTDQVIEPLKDKTRLSFWSTSEPEVLALTLSFGAEARLIEPEGLVGEIKSVVEAMSKSYG